MKQLKNSLIILLLIPVIGNCQIPNKFIKLEDGRLADSGIFIIPALDKSHIKGPHFSIDLALSKNHDTIGLINSLLELAGDVRLSGRPFLMYPNITAKRYHKSSPRFSVQVEALYIINMIFLGSSTYSPYPVLVDKRTNIEQSIDGELIKEAFVGYKLWFATVKKLGLKNAQKMHLYPLDSTNVKWY